MSEEKSSLHFIEQIIIDEDLASNGLDPVFVKFVLDFPPEPNGFLHIGHVKAICTVNFSLAKKYKAPVNFAFRRYKPRKRRAKQYIDAIKE